MPTTSVTDDGSSIQATAATTLVVVDGAGNDASDSVVINTRYLDDTNPTISSFGADDTTITLKTSAQSQTVTYTAVASDNAAMDNVKFDNNDPTSTSGNTYTYTKTYSYGSYSFGNSSDTVSVTATDTAGNTSTSSQSVTITKIDDQSPTISSFTSCLLYTSPSPRDS